MCPQYESIKCNPTSWHTHTLAQTYIASSEFSIHKRFVIKFVTKHSWSKHCQSLFSCQQGISFHSYYSNFFIISHLVIGKRCVVLYIKHCKTITFYYTWRTNNIKTLTKSEQSRKLLCTNSLNTQNHNLKAMHGITLYKCTQ